MEQRELGTNEIIDRLNGLINSFSLKDVILLPSVKVTRDDMPCLLVHLGEDVIFKRSSRNEIGYSLQASAWRTLTVIVECWELSRLNVLTLYKEARKAVLKDKNGVLINKVTVKEVKADGPFYAAEIDGAYGMRLYLSMNYPDEGPLF